MNHGNPAPGLPEFDPNRNIPTSPLNPVEGPITRLPEDETGVEQAISAEPSGTSYFTRADAEGWDDDGTFSSLEHQTGVVLDRMETDLARQQEAGITPSQRDIDAIRSLRIAARVLSHLPDGMSFDQRSVNDVIASYQDELLISSVPVAPSSRILPNVWGYLRDKHGAQKIGDGLDAVRCGAVPKNIVELWIEEGAVGNGYLDDAMLTAYPDLADKLSESKQRNREAFQKSLDEMRGSLREA